MSPNRFRTVGVLLVLALCALITYLGMLSVGLQPN